MNLQWIWMLWSFIPWLNWAAWVHAAIRAKQPRYYVYAVIYATPTIFAICVAGANQSPNSVYSNVAASLAILSWVVGIIHVQIKRKAINFRIKCLNNAVAQAVTQLNGKIGTADNRQFPPPLPNSQMNAQTKDVQVRSETVGQVRTHGAGPAVHSSAQGHQDGTMELRAGKPPIIKADPSIGKSRDDVDVAQSRSDTPTRVVNSISQNTDTAPPSTPRPPTGAAKMNLIWYCKIGGGEQGPFSSEGLRNLVKSAKLSPLDLIWREGLKEWVAAANVKGLFTNSNSQPPPTLHAAPQAGDNLIGQLSEHDLAVRIVKEKLLEAASVSLGLPKGTFLGRTSSAEVSTRIRRILEMPDNIEILVGYENPIRLFGTWDCAVVADDKVFVSVCHGKIKRVNGVFDLLSLECSSFAFGVKIASIGSKQMTLPAQAKPFFRWLDAKIKIAMTDSRLKHRSQDIEPKSASNQATSTAAVQSQVLPTMARDLQQMSPVAGALSPYRKPVDLNNAPEEVIADLPGVGPILAKKAIGIRQSTGGFASLEGFAEALGLKPHIVERLRDLVVVVPVPQQEPSALRGRVVDF